MTSAPIGTFHAHSTRDAEALIRDGWPYFAITRLEETSKPPAERDLFEIQFEDGLWMLARLDDLVAVVPGVGVSRA
jgi:hypothetical protein